MLEAHLVRKGFRREVFALVKRNKIIFQEDVDRAESLRKEFLEED